MPSASCSVTSEATTARRSRTTTIRARRRRREEGFDFRILGLRGLPRHAGDAAGRPTHSFNLGIDGMMPPESLHMARTLLAMRPPHFKRLFLEVSSTRDMPDIRALTVRDFLTNKGIASGRIDVRALGANVPSGDPDRVEVKAN